MRDEGNIIYRRGFTLIELLVVIAIIGILAGIIFASLSSARFGGNEAKTIATLNQVRNAAELYALANNGSYGSDAGNCITGMFTDSASGMVGLVASSNFPSGAARACFVIASLNAWAVRITHDPSATLKYFCVDSSGVATTSSAQMLIGSDANCDVNNTTP